MLNDREKWLIHYCCMATIAKITGLPDAKEVVTHILQDVRKNRCRSLTDEDVISLLEDTNEEMVSGKNLFNYLIDEIVRTTEDKHDGHSP